MVVVPVNVKDETYTLNSEVDSAKWYSVSEAKENVMKNSLAEYFLNLSLKKFVRTKMTGLPKE